MGWNAKVRCVRAIDKSATAIFKENETYDVIDDVLYYKNGKGCNGIKNMECLENTFSSKFELVDADLKKNCNNCANEGLLGICANCFGGEVNGIMSDATQWKPIEVIKGACKAIDKDKPYYWDNICKIQQRQTDKGLNKYGQILEENIEMTPEERITYLQEELIDGLMYCEHIKQNNYNGLTPNDYQKAALRTASDQSKENLILNGALGLSGETGEVSDHIKKNLFQGHALDKDYLAKELGDICWYIAILSEGIGYELSEVMQMNIDKLKKRYPNGFDKERSLHRENEETQCK